LPFLSGIYKIRRTELSTRMKPFYALGHPIDALKLASRVPRPTATTIDIRPLKETIGA